MSIDNATPADWSNASNKWFHNSWSKQQGLSPKVTPPKSLPEILEEKFKDYQVGGDHYKGKIEPWDVMMEWQLDPWLANVIKYIQRHRKKAGKEDLEKAKHYLDFAIANYDAISTKYYK